MTITLAPFPFNMHPAESAEDRICRCVHDCDGLTLHDPRLAQLIGRGVDPVTLGAANWLTDCATTALGVIVACCGNVESAKMVHPLLGQVSRIGESMSWLFQIAADLDCKISAKAGPELRPGDLLYFETPGTNDNHVEWLLGTPTALGYAPHGGGGRTGNAMSVGSGLITSSMGRPLTWIFRFAPHLPVSADYATGEIVTDNGADGGEVRASGRDKEGGDHSVGFRFAK